MRLPAGDVTNTAEERQAQRTMGCTSAAPVLGQVWAFWPGLSLLGCFDCLQGGLAHSTLLKLLLACNSLAGRQAGKQTGRGRTALLDSCTCTALAHVTHTGMACLHAWGELVLWAQMQQDKDSWLPAPAKRSLTLSAARILASMSCSVMLCEDEVLHGGGSLR